MLELREVIDNCEAALRAGRGPAAAKLLNQLKTATIPREQRLLLANLCRRAGLVTQGLKILSPVVRGQIGLSKSSTPTVEEWAEYAVLLQRNGVVREALQILSRPGMEKTPPSLLYKAFCHFNQWDYVKAVPTLELYVEADLVPYTKLVGQTNLAAAYIGTRQYDKAIVKLDENLRFAKAGNYQRLLSNNLELRAIVHIDQTEFAQAKSCLHEASAILGQSDTLDQLFVQKWLAAIDSFETKQTEALDRFRSTAVLRKDYESVREADLLKLRVQFEEPLFCQLYFGTPFEAYQKRIRETLRLAPSRTHHRLGDDSGPTFDLQTAELDGSPAVSVGGKTHQLIEVLYRDFYKPIGIGGLASELFVGEYFDIETSPDRVHQILRRARTELKASPLPLRIVEQSQQYAVVNEAPIQILVPLQRQSVQWELLQIEKLKANLEKSTAQFKAVDARARLNLSPAEFKRLASWATENGYLERYGAGPATTYSISTTSQK